METLFSKKVSRRDFLIGAGGALGALAALGMPCRSSFATQMAPAAPTYPGLNPEPSPVLRVLRWSEFVRSEKEIWLSNTKQWEDMTGGRVETDFLPWTDFRPKAALEAIIGAGHDIAYGFFDDPHLYPDKLLDLTEQAEYLGKKYGGWYPICEIYGRVSGTRKWIALPVRASGACLNFRVSRIREAGFESMPGTVSGFLACCKALRAKGHYTGFSLGHATGDANTWTHWWLWSFGGKAVEADNRTPAINSPQTIQALEAARVLYETMIPGVEKWLDGDNNAAFLNGSISVTVNESSIVYAARQNHPDIDADLSVVNLPVGPVGHPAELSAISSGFVFRHTLVPNAARHYLTFMLETEQYGKWISQSYGYITQALKQYYDLPAWKKDLRITPYREIASRALPNSHAGQPGTASAAVMNQFIIVDMFADACMGRRSPRQAVLDAEAKIARIYK